MGVFLNPGNFGFQSILRSDYVDKTGLVGVFNRMIGTEKRLVL